MSHRSVIQTLDLPDNYGDYDNYTPQSYGWLSPRISFSTDFINGQSNRLSDRGDTPDSRKSDEASSLSEFEFSMSSSTLHDAASQGFIMTADELFHGGKLLPGYIIPSRTTRDVVIAEPVVPERVEESSVTIARHLSAESLTDSLNTPSPPAGCVLGHGCPRTPRTPKWRELFGALRRVKSDSGRQRMPDENFLPPPKPMQGRKKFFKHFFSNGLNATDAKLSNLYGPTVYRSYASPASHATQPMASTSFPTSTSSPSGSAGTSSCSLPADCKDKAVAVNLPQASGSCESGRGECSSSSSSSSSSPALSRRGSCSESTLAEGTSSSQNKGWASSARSAGGRSTSVGAAVRKVERPAASANLVRSASGRVIVRNLDRATSNVKNSATLQDQIRALRSREIRRSPDRNGYSTSVRVTPVLNVPVCMGPVLRGASKAGKGRLSNFRSLLSFKREKLPTSLSTPIATQ